MSRGCCSVILWDFIVATAIITNMLFMWLDNPNVFLCGLVGVIASIVIIYSMNLKYVGLFFQILISYCWTVLVLKFFLHFKWYQYISDEPGWKWVVKGAVFIIFFGSHLISIKALQESNWLLNLPFIKKIDKNKINQNNFSSAINYEEIDKMNNLVDVYEEICDNIWSTFTKISDKTDGDEITSSFIEKFNEKETDFRNSYDIFKNDVNEKLRSNILKHCSDILGELKRLYMQMEEYYESLPDASTDSKYEEEDWAENNNMDFVDVSLFAGCNSIESLSKRYKNLMKTFHPDNEDGDTEMTQKIQITYEQLQKEYM